MRGVSGHCGSALARVVSRAGGASLALVLAGSLALVGEAPARAYAALDFEYAGCARVRPGPWCELGAERELTFWVAGDTPLSLEARGATPANVRQSRAVEGGQQVRFRVPREAGVVRLRAGARRGELRVAESAEPAQIRELTRSWRAGQTERVQALLEQPAPQRAAERERLRALRARLAMRAGDNERAAAELEATANSAREAGLLLEAGNDLLAAAYCRAVRLAQLARARDLLEGAPLEVTGVPENRARLAYYRGVVARVAGDAQGALVHFRKASVLARRLGLVTDERLARQELAVALTQLQRPAEGLAEQRQLVAEGEDEPSCARSVRWDNLAWMLLSQEDPALQQQAAGALDRAEQLRESCPDAASRRTQALNRVELALARRDEAEAETRLSALETDAQGGSTRLAAWQAELWGELHLLRGDRPRALVAFDRAFLLAEGAQAKDCAYRARLGRARALANDGGDAAARAYELAEDAADALVRWAPFGQGQQLTALRAQDSARELLSLLLERGENERAEQVAMRAARRVWGASLRASRIASATGPLRQRWEQAIASYRARREELERAARDDWKLSREGLEARRLSRSAQLQWLSSALADADALLGSEPNARTEPSTDGDARLLLAAGTDAWWAFLARGPELRVELVSRFAAGAPLSLSPARRGELERGLAAALERGRRAGRLEAPLLRVTLPPELASIDVHALEVAGRPLVDWLPVAYALDPGAGRERPPPVDAARGALVLGDPNRDLGWAATEAQRVAQRFPNAQLLFGEQVDFPAVARALPRSQLLHFAGHASSGGVDGLDSGLLLSGDRRLSLGDVLALERAPDVVILSSCTSSVSAELGGGLSIGQAFLMAGSRVVVGAGRAISDSLAPRFMQALYDRLPAAGFTLQLPYDRLAWAEAVRGAGQDVRRADPNADWASMRLLLP
jgi:cellulose synthase operon protein C